RRGPRRPDPERTDPDGTVETAPPILPPGFDVRRRHAAERLPQPLLARGVRIGRELEAIRPVDLLEAFREQLDHRCTRLLRPDGRNRHRDAPEAQRNALFSFSKNPSSARWVAAGSELWSSRSRR